MSIQETDALSVLLIEDDPEHAHAIRTYLSELDEDDVSVVQAGRFDEGMEHMRTNPPHVALVDLTLPDSGPETTIDRLAEMPDEVAVVALTGGPSMDFELQAIESGADEFLNKDVVDAEVLARCVDHAVERSNRRRELQLTRRAANSAGEGVVMTDARREDNPITFVNAGFLELTGYAEAEVMDRNCRFLQCGATDERSVAEIRRAIDREEPITIELLNQRADGTQFWNQLSISLVRNEDNEVTHFVGFQRDVTRRVTAERDLKQNQRRLERYETIVENTTDVVVIKDRDGNYTLVNQAFIDLVGMQESEILGKTAGDLFEREFDEDHRDRERDVMTSGAIKNYEESIAVDELERTFLTTSIPFREEGEVRGIVSISRDITERKRMQDTNKYLALHDALTDLPNRTLFRDRFEQAAERVQRRGRPFAVGFVDLDDFKAVNDSFGHATGDELMRRVASRLQSTVRSEDTVARAGGDEFLLLLECGEQRESLEMVGRRLQASFEPPFDIGNDEVHLSLSIGFSFPDDQSLESGDFIVDMESLLHTADRAMYEAKQKTGTSWHMLAPSNAGENSRRIQRENRIRQGIEDGEFVPFYQPIYRLADRSVVAVEVLARWRHPERGVVSPAQFIPLAEQSDLICDLGDAILERVYRDFECETWRVDGEQSITVYVNLSARQLDRPRAVDQLVDSVRASNCETIDIGFEVTETQCLEHRAPILALRRSGFEVVVDDFGTGYSSLSRLKEIPADGLKLDMEFVQGITKDTADSAIAKTVVRLGELLGIPVIAEGIEREKQIDCLNEMTCGAGQGFWLARPQPFEQLVELFDGQATGKAP